MEIFIPICYNLKQKLTENLSNHGTVCLIQCSFELSVFFIRFTYLMLI